MPEPASETMSAAEPAGAHDDAPLMLSVSGARGIVGRTMTPAIAADFAAAYGSFVKARSGRSDPLFVVGRDSRPSGAMLLSAASAGLVAVGCRVVDVGVVATPSVGVMIDHHAATAGIVVTASHNPIEWNGLKCLNQDGVAPPAEEAGEIIRRFTDRAIEYAPVRALHAPMTDRTANEMHVARVLANVDGEAIRRSAFRVVLDSVNGGGCVSGRMILDELGCEVMHLNGDPTGVFAHTPEPIEANLDAVIATTRTAAAAVGFAQDPDADRLAIVDETGRYIGEEYTLVLAAKRLLDLAGAEARSAVLAANLSTSRMIDDVAARYGATVVRTAVGEANVAAAMQAADSALVGGEGNGGVIWPTVCWVRDSLSSMAVVLSLLAAEDRPLSAIVDDLPRYAMIKRKVDLSATGGRAVVDEAIRRVADGLAGKGRVDTADGVRVDFEDGWVHLRSSNTEPIVRLIAEGPTPDRAEALASRVKEVARL